MSARKTFRRVFYFPYFSREQVGCLDYKIPISDSPLLDLPRFVLKTTRSATRQYLFRTFQLVGWRLSLPQDSAKASLKCLSAFWSIPCLFAALFRLAQKWFIVNHLDHLTMPGHYLHTNFMVLRHYRPLNHLQIFHYKLRYQNHHPQTFNSDCTYCVLSFFSPHWTTSSHSGFKRCL